MKDVSATFHVRDDAGKRHRGLLVATDLPPTAAPEAPHEFRIVLLRAPLRPETVPDASAVCVPALSRAASASPSAESVLTRAALLTSELPGDLREQYRAGVIVHPGGELAGHTVFPSSGAAHFDPLALMLIDQARSEALAPYVALIRSELALGPGVDAVLGLEARLRPANRDARPPSGAPAVRRLARVEKALARRQVPAISLEELVDDLRFLSLFADDASLLRGAALERLLRDVQSPPAPEAPPPAAVTPLRRHKKAR